MNAGLWLERFAEHLTLIGRSPTTIYSYHYSLKMFLTFLSDRGLNEVHEIRREDVEAFQVFLHIHRHSNRSLSLATQNGYLASVLAFLKFLCQSGVLLANPGRGIKLVKVPRKLIGVVLDEEEVLSLLTAPNTSVPLGLRDRAILEVLYSSALRNSELRDLALGDVDLQRLQIRIHLGKGRKSRVVPLGEPAAAWVEEYLKNGRTLLLRKRDPGALFVTIRGAKMNPENVSDLVRKYAGKAGLAKRVTPHLLRHCCATHMLARQADLRHLQELLGHSSPETTQLYTKVNISDLREVHRRCHPRESF